MMATNREVTRFGEWAVPFLGAASVQVMPHVFPDGARESGVFADVCPVEEVGDLSGLRGGWSSAAPSTSGGGWKPARRD